MKKIHIVILVLLVLIAYLNTLQNSFFGDDKNLLVNNTFYSSWSNVPRLFQKGVVTDGKEYLFVYGAEDKGSFNPSFRILDKLTFFSDYSLWGKNPLGYHLENIFIHLLNVILLYLIVIKFFPSNVAFFAAFLFGVHPALSEPVAVISYRGDLLATFFVLLSFYRWIKFSEYYKNIKHYWYSLCFFLLAVLTKESTAVLPLVILLYQWLFNKQKALLQYQVGFWIILCFYLIVYFFIYPHSVLVVARHNFLEQGCVIIRVLFEYLKAFALPWFIHPLPPDYSPFQGKIIGIEVFIHFFVILLLFFFSLIVAKRNNILIFFIAWFLVFYLPISNIIPLLNLMAYRYFYLPSIGLCVFISFFVMHNKKLSVQILFVIWGFFISLIFQTIYLNCFMKNSIVAEYYWIKNYPDNIFGYSFLGQDYFSMQKYDEAKEVLEMGLKHGMKDPFAKNALANCYMIEHEKEKAKNIFQEIILESPWYPDAYCNLAQIYSLENKKQEAIQLIKKARQINPKSCLFMRLN